MTRSTWARRFGVAAAVAAVALVAAACSSQPSASRSTKAQAKAHEVTFPAPYGVMTPYSYGPSWARFVAAFPLWTPVTLTGQPGRNGRWQDYAQVPCTQAQAQPSYDATDGHGYHGSTPLPPSFVVRIWRCPSVAVARRFVAPALDLRGDAHLVIDGHAAVEPPTSRITRAGGRPYYFGGIIFRDGAIAWNVTAAAMRVAVVKAFLGSFSLDTSGYPASHSVAPSR